MIGEAKLHRGRDSVSLVNAAEIVMGDVECDGGHMVFQLL